MKPVKLVISTKFVHEIINLRVVITTMETCIATIAIYYHMVMIQVQIGFNVARMMYSWIGG